MIFLLTPIGCWRSYLKDIWVPLSGAIAQQRKVDTIANNIANANTPGFKKDKLVFKEYLTALDKGIDNIDLPKKEWKPDDFYHSQGGEKALVKVDGSYTDFTQGQLTPTGNPLDVAIYGKGFFEVLTPNGVRYTRRGSLSISQEGKLVTDQGFPVLSALSKAQLESQGRDESASFIIPEKRVIQIPQGRVAISREGNIMVSGQPLAKLSVVEFHDHTYLKKQGHALYVNRDNDNLRIDNIKSTVSQGHVEQSNVNAIEEMSELIKANRHFESIQRAMKAYDAIGEKAVNGILKF